MKVRLWGTVEETTAAAERLIHTPGLVVLSVSEPRADRGASVLVRVYVEARLDPPPGPEHVTCTTEPQPRSQHERASQVAQRITRDRALLSGDGQ